MNFKRNLVIIAILNSFSLLSCGGSHKDSDSDNQTPPRSGVEVIPIDVKYYDALPDISADGKRIVFISGRDKGTLRAFKYDQTVGSQVSRLTQTDATFDIEKGVFVSPDGKWVILSALKDGKTNLFLKDFALTIQTEHQITNDAGLKSQIAFSPDSKIIAYMRQDPTSGRREIWVAQINTDGTSSDPQMISSSSQDELNPVFQPLATGASGYALVTVVPDLRSSQSSIVRRSFETFESAKSATKTDIATGLRLAAEIPLTASKNGVYITVKVPLGDAKYREITPGGSVTTTKKAGILNTAMFLDTSTKALTDLTLPALGILSQSIGQDDFGIFLTKAIFSCKADSLSYGTAMISYVKSTGKTSFLIPRTKADQNQFEVSPDFCTTTRADKTEGSLYTKVTYSKMSSNSTADSYKAVFVTWDTKDYEVMSVDATASTVNFNPISNNKSP